MARPVDPVPPPIVHVAWSDGFGIAYQAGGWLFVAPGDSAAVVSGDDWSPGIALAVIENASVTFTGSGLSFTPGGSGGTLGGTLSDGSPLELSIGYISPAVVLIDTPTEITFVALPVLPRVVSPGADVVASVVQSVFGSAAVAAHKTSPDGGIVPIVPTPP